MLKKIASVFMLVILGLCILYGIYSVYEKKKLQIAEGLYAVYRTELINKIIEKKDFHDYLEIGLSNPYANYVHVNAENKTSVDPFEVSIYDYNKEENINNWLKYCTHRMTSDEFFAQNKNKFDIIFIDGLHEHLQTDKDIYNSLQVLNEDGYIIVRDVKPDNEEQQIVPRQTNGIWTGDVWRSFYKIAKINNPNLEVYIVNKDRGLGIIHKKRNVNYEIPKDSDISWQQYNENILNIAELVEWQDLDDRIK